MTKAQLLGADLLANTRVLGEIDRWVRVMDRPNGWHYDLDIVWLIESLERAGVKPGMTVVDAGAGLGIPQYVLAARGYRVISLDYAQRDIPSRSRGIFDIRQAETPRLDYQHPYLSHMTFVGKRRTLGSIARRIAAEPVAAALSVWDVGRKVARVLANWAEKARDHSRFGAIEFVHASFHNIPLADASVDAVISVSAIEHSEKDVIAQAFAEMRRITRPGGPILITSSATGSSKDVFHEPTKGHCFSKDSVVALVGEPCAVEFDYARVEAGLIASPVLWRRLAPYYYRWKSGLFHDRKRMHSLPYLPVGLRLQ